jgi:hypothetical protein
MDASCRPLRHGGRTRIRQIHHDETDRLGSLCIALVTKNERETKRTSLFPMSVPRCALPCSFESSWDACSLLWPNARRHLQYTQIRSEFTVITVCSSVSPVGIRPACRACIAAGAGPRSWACQTRRRPRWQHTSTRRHSHLLANTTDESKGVLHLRGVRDNLERTPRLGRTHGRGRMTSAEGE